MKTKFAVIGLVILVISIFINLTLSFNLMDKSDKYKKEQTFTKNLQEENKNLKEDLSEAEGVISNEKLKDDQESKKVVEGFFKAQYEYNTETYKDRFKEIKQYVNEDVYGQLTTAGIPDIPNIKFENKINDMKLYWTAENNELMGLVLLETIYKVEGVTNPPTTQIFQVKVAEKEGKQEITSLETLGTFAPMTES
ncbi:hypothetical protein [Pontibacillus litoralis]|uniref:Uncharacterized protein n=1 Tax=Pontibacillus litoralis JSM 072002 TaxID=1385512 RepID=A0A0A5HNG0_9BACI|nr:hypothetical protein [Pontibacillus litoralis]KGX85177.1 hypothetical protein N784_09785 [Pontibacillus litoralis JSM 072002]